MTNDLKFSGESPVVINYNGSPDDIYAPVRTSNCDITVVSPKILDDLYTAKKDEICVRIQKGNTTIWEGYKMPNTYSQEVSLNLDNITMTCIDPVSILKFVTIDKILKKPKIVTYGTIIGKALAYVMISSNSLWVERTVSYDGSYDGTNGLLTMEIQVANFWDESGKPSTVYEVIEEMLRPFCLTLVYYDNSYQIYNPNKTTGTRRFDKYTININGTLTSIATNVEEVKASGLYDFASDAWKSNNTQIPTIEINSTYDKVTGVASTSIPNYSRMVFDIVDYTQRDKYAYDDLNVQKNKTKGYVKRGSVISLYTADSWFYIWNGVYCDANFNLVDSGGYTDWYINFNKAKTYLDGGAGHPNDIGSVLNFYGGINNPTATGKTATERSVKVNKRITAYAPDNGTPLEFLETSDLAWTCNGYRIDKVNSSNAKFGTPTTMQTSNRVVYHQMYENVLMTNDQQTINLDLSCSFSRTGIDVPFDPLNNNTATDCHYSLGNLQSCNSNYFPASWNSSNVVVNSIYFRRYSPGGNIHVTPIWDRRRIDMYVRLSNNSVLQFNGKEWVSDLHVEVANSFYLKKLMNGEKLYHNDHRCNIIECADGSEYSLWTEPVVYRTNSNGEVVESVGTEHSIPVYHSDLNEFNGLISECSDGHLSIILPTVNDPGAVVYVDVYNSQMLGMTGSDDSGTTPAAPFYYPNSSGTSVKECPEGVTVMFLPANITYVKAEHLNLDINISVPESNLGQMFDESDIKYELNSDNDYVEEYEGPSFQINTYNPLVASSFSYLIYNNSIADPNLFIVNSRLGRPEAYTVQAYFNWLSKIRKIYNKTLIPYPNYVRTRPFSNVRCYITSPEVGNNELLVVRDTWDVKTDRHTVTAVEDHDLEVVNVSTVDVIEIPRMARAERYNLPTAKK